MKHTLSFEPSVIKSFQGKVATEKWDDVVAAYDSGACKEAMLLLLDYIDGNIRKSYGTGSDTGFAIPHGSVTVQLRITDTGFTVKAPFLKVSETTKRVPLYRRIAELNFNPLNLPQIVLDNEALYFSYECPIQCCEPYKMYYVLKDICTYADTYDDDFVSKFGAVPAGAAKTECYDPRVLDRAYATIKAFLDEAAGFIQYLEEKRYTNSIWYVVNITLKKIDFYIAPQGSLRKEIEDTVHMLYSEIPFEDRIRKGKQYLLELRKKEKEELTRYLYRAEVFVPFKYNGSLDNVKQEWEDAYKNARKELGDKYFMAACLTLTLAMYNIFYYSNVQDAIAQKVIRLLEHTARKPWESAAHELFDGMSRIMEDKPLHTGKKGFFKKLFK